jgi:deoxyribodipyrimidine photolyase
VENKTIHEWDKETHNTTGIYIKPIVDYSEQKEKALKMYKEV